MIGFAVMMVFVSGVLVYASVSLSQGNTALLRGKREFVHAADPAALAKALSRPMLLMGGGAFLSGAASCFADSETQFCFIMGFLLVTAVCALGWGYMTVKRHS